MRETVTSVLARERRLDLQRAAGCCTALIEHRRSAARAVRRARWFSPKRPAATPPIVCCV